MKIIAQLASGVLPPPGPQQKLQLSSGNSKLAQGGRRRPKNNRFGF